MEYIKIHQKYIAYCDVFCCILRIPMGSAPITILPPLGGYVVNFKQKNLRELEVYWEVGGVFFYSSK